jgi:hypothetical protein
MLNAFRRDCGPTAGPAADPTDSLPRRHRFFSSRGGRLATWLVLPTLLMPLAGCGSGSSKKAGDSTAVAQTDQAQEEEKEAPAPAAPAPKKKQRAALIPAEPDLAAASSNDITKWKSADLDSAILRKDPLFVLAAVVYSANGPNDAKRAGELDALVRKVARLKDDATIPLALPSGVFASADVEAPAAPAKAAGTPAAAPGSPRPKKGGAFRFGGK